MILRVVSAATLEPFAEVDLNFDETAEVYVQIEWPDGETLQVEQRID